MDLQNVANWTIPEGGVRNLHDKDNRLLWSAVGYDVKYKGDTTQQTYGGKNLFDKNDASLVLNEFYINDGTGTIKKATGTESIYIPCSPNTTYTISKMASSRFIACYVTEMPANNLTAYGIVRRSNQDTYLTITTGASAAYLVVYYKSSSDTVTGETIRSTIQIELGSTPTSYEPYVGGYPAPNPDYPQDVNVVQGAQNVKITGKNILSNDITTQTFHGVNITRNPDSSLTLNGTVDLGSYNYYLNIGQLNVKKGETYTISGLSGWNYNTLQIYTPSSIAFPSGNRLSCSVGPNTVTAMGDETVNVNLYFYEGQVYENVNVCPMVEVSNSVSSYEPYQGQTFPVDLGSTELCKIGNYQDYIFKSSGKNIWGGYTAFHKEANGMTFDTTVDGFITAIGTATGIAYSILGSEAASNGTYITLQAGTYRLSVDGTLPSGVGIQVADTSGSVISSSTGSFTVSAATNVVVRLRVDSGTAITNGITVYPMLSVGSSSTSYEPYGTDWYVCKEIGKVVLDGSEENLERQVSQTARSIFYLPVDDIEAYTNAYAIPRLISNRFIPATYNATCVPGDISRYTNKSDIRFVVWGSTSLTDFKTWLASNNVVVYYVLATPSYTKITDNTLIGQLDAIHDWLRRYDYYGVVSGNLPIIINRSGII